MTPFRTTQQYGQFLYDYIQEVLYGPPEYMDQQGFALLTWLATHTDEHMQQCWYLAAGDGIRTLLMRMQIDYQAWQGDHTSAPPLFQKPFHVSSLQLIPSTAHFQKPAK